LGPPGGVGEDGRAVLAPGELTGEEGRGEDYCEFKSARILWRSLQGNWRMWCGSELELGIGIASVRTREGLREGSVPF